MSELVSQTLTNLQNGVSQQTPALRYSNQCEQQENCRNDPVDGMGKRYNTVMKGQMAGLTEPQDYLIETIERDSLEKYKFCAKSHSLKIFDASTGFEYPVSMAAEFAPYLIINSNKPARESFQFLNTIDTTFLLNKTVPVKRKINSEEVRAPEALWYVKQADYKTTYKVVLNGTTCSITTPEATSTRARSGLDTTGMTSDMKNAINDKTATHGCTATAQGNVLYITHHLGEDFTISSSDDLGDRASYAIKGWLNDFTDLPPYAVEGFRVEIRGDAGDTDVEPYHVAFTTYDNEGGQTGGVWKETLKHGADYEFDLYTMPISIKRTQDAGNVSAENPLGITFVVEQTPFSERSVGDDVTAPFPSFCSVQDEVSGAVLSPRHIQAMIYHKNRLCFVSDENLVFSETGEYMNFFPTTVVTELDADPIDIALNLNDVAPVEHVLINAGQMFLFAPEVQLRVRHGEIFSAATIDVTVASREEVDTRVAPFVHGSMMYFWRRGTNFSTLYEYVPQGDTERYVALEVSSHVPRYVDGLMQKTVDSASENTMFHLTRNDDLTATNKLRITNILMNGPERVQNAWQTWTFAGDIIDASVDQDVLSLIVAYDDGVFIEEMVLSHDSLKSELGFPVYLDRREEVNSSFMLPEGDTRTLFENKGRYWVGHTYNQKYVFSQFFLRSQEKAVIGGRLQLRYLTLAFNETTSFKVTVVRGGVDSRVKQYDGRRVGSLDALLGSVPVKHGTAKFPIHTRSENAVIVIENDSLHDSVFQTAEWEGTYTRRSRRA